MCCWAEPYVKYINMEEAQSARRKNTDASHHSTSARSTLAIIQPERRMLLQPLWRVEAGNHNALMRIDNRVIQTMDTTLARSLGPI